MTRPEGTPTEKSSVEEIRARFDADVERFSNLETGQSATMDAPFVLELMTEAAAASTPRARHLLDIGCGAGNYSLKMLERLPDLDVTLLDLSQPMLDRAQERVASATQGKVRAIRGDIRQIDLGEGQFDIMLAGMVFHHLRNPREWDDTFRKCFGALRPGGSLWIADLIAHETAPAQAMMWRRYGEYLTKLQDEAYRDRVFTYIEREDSPSSLVFQLDLLRTVGFESIEILHKTHVFATFGGIRGR